MQRTHQSECTGRLIIMSRSGHVIVSECSFVTVLLICIYRNHIHCMCILLYSVYMYSGFPIGFWHNAQQPKFDKIPCTIE